ncbi:unnamed protein product [Gadus morhua 'NCC']
MCIRDTSQPHVDNASIRIVWVESATTSRTGPAAWWPAGVWPNTDQRNEGAVGTVAKQPGRTCSSSAELETETERNSSLVNEGSDIRSCSHDNKQKKKEISLSAVCGHGGLQLQVQPRGGGLQLQVQPRGGGLQLQVQPRGGGLQLQVQPRGGGLQLQVQPRGGARDPVYICTAAALL